MASRSAAIIGAGLLCVGWAGSASAIGLEAAYRKALEHDPKLEAARERYRAEQERVPQARAQLMPRLNAEANYTASEYDRNVVERNPRTLEIERDQVMQSETSYEAAVTLQQVLFDMPSWQKLGQAREAVNQAEIKLKQAKQDLAKRVGEAYLDLVLKARKVALARKQQKTYQKRWEKLRAQLEKGLSNRMDVLQAKARTKRAQSEVVSSEKQVEVARLNLERIIGESVSQVEGKRIRPPEDAKTPDAAVWVERARQNNLNVRLAKAGIEMAAESKDAAQGQFWPTFTAYGRYSETNARDQTIGGTDRRVYLQMKLPLYEGGKNFSGLREASARVAESRRKLDDARRQAELQVRESRAQLTSGMRRVASLQESVASARTYVQAAEEGYEQGLRDLVAVLDARAEVYSVRRELAQALHDELVARLNLHRAAGKLDREILGLLDQRLRSRTAN